MEKHSTENKNAQRISYKQSDNWINTHVHSCVLHAAASRSSYSNFVARAALKWLCPLPCNTLRVVSVSVVAYSLVSWSPQQKQNLLLELLFPMHRVGRVMCKIHLPGDHGHCSRSPRSSSDCPVWQPCCRSCAVPGLWLPVSIPSITRGGINGAVGWQ